MEKQTSERVGQRLIDVLTLAWLKPFSVQSNFAREHAKEVAALSSSGFITTKTLPGHNLYSTNWKITLAGLECLMEETE